MDLQDKKVLVVGSGKSGIGAVKLLHKAGAVPVLYDSNEKLSAKEIREKAGLSGLEVILGTIPESRKKEFALVAISPGVPIDAPLRRCLCLYGEKLNWPIPLPGGGLRRLREPMEKPPQRHW